MSLFLWGEGGGLRRGGIWGLSLGFRKLRFMPRLPVHVGRIAEGGDRF